MMYLDGDGSAGESYMPFEPSMPDSMPEEPRVPAAVAPPPAQAQAQAAIVSQPPPLMSMPHDHQRQQQQQQMAMVWQQQQLHQRPTMQYAQQQQYEPGYVDLLWDKRREVFKLCLLTLVILLAISSHTAVWHYLEDYINDAVLTSGQELALRLAYPAIVLIVLWHFKTFLTSK